MRIQTKLYAYVTGTNRIKVIHSFNWQLEYSCCFRDYQPAHGCHPLRDKLKEELSL